MWLLLSAAVLAAICAVFGLLVWFACGIARVDEHRTAADRRLIGELAKHPTNTESGQPT